METPLPSIPAAQTQKQGSQDRVGRVLQIGNQLDGQQGHGSSAPSTQETRNGNPFLLEDRKQLNRIAPVGSDRPAAMFLAANGANRSEEGGKINPTGKKRFLVFPNRAICVRIGKLNLSAPCPQGAGFGLLKPLGLSPCGAWLFYRGQFLTS